MLRENVFCKWTAEYNVKQIEGNCQVPKTNNIAKLGETSYEENKNTNTVKQIKNISTWKT